ncbi:DUF72 domain-containing protein [Chitinophaga rhizophila]|uniref:DUF72 domain-containing protein n=1 Tax=Chitinophaga rhizophila TaxID=2866212 RepID=A0ABS7GEX8_9BACT|nr:DUF72 domain-containing protein [Chitinophaga rhizophila]MBW8685063.1 DUF72 domain-containing protein [Chitinophaga rhizophila]
MAKGKIHIGTSGWSYKHWREIFYPPAVKPADYLSYYADHFHVSEINMSFYRLPTLATVEKWAHTVNSRFRFCPKISRFVTHTKKLNDPELTLPRFFDIFDPVHKHLGPILIQLPERLPFNKEKAAHFFKVLTQYKGHSFALEPRHTSWMEDEAIALLKRYKIAFVIADAGDRWPYGEFVTAKHIYVRFHGPDGSYAKSYDNTVLKKYARKMIAWRDEGHTVWVFFNNDIHGYAFENARTLIEYTAETSI